eukprot:CAMPEP_0185018244 /NCGR_PEP_ID=MMETSP1103-20130426/1030_1 /TAXON_ID=36769 /ORGANISM="Paraphysomonas bandaiensis, Strain Caron Lab Isolate" /LENGTH=496 /DNA_ID=CAMNT_0027547987 /DNA_START=39 /DNA_END=1529 /DNA_ORIENTATION=+
MIGVVLIAAATILIGTVILHLVSHFSRYRSDIIKESYPFQNTIELAWNSGVILDYLIEKYKCKPESQKCGVFNTLGLPWIVFTNDVDNITYILKNVDTFGKGPLFSEKFHGLLGDGIFNSDGKVWYKHRKTSSHLFNLNKFKSSVLDTFNAHCNVLIDILANTSQPVDIQDLYMKFTLESIGQIAFGQELGTMTQKRVIFADAFDYCQAQINESFMDPLWRLKRFFTPAGWWYYICLSRVNRFAYSVVRQRRLEFAERSAASKSKGDLLSLYLERQDENDGQLTDKNLRDVVLSFVIAGRDTTANALSWATYRLCIHPDIQLRVYNEIVSVLKSYNLSHKDPSLRLSYECLQEMKYLEAFCMEVLRLYPSVPKEAKFALKDDTLPDGTFVPKGYLVIFCPWLMGRTESLWENCMTFNPDRFFNTPKPSPFKFTAFQAGPRICLGQNLAMLEMKCVLARLLLSFSFKLEQDADTVTYMSTISMPIKDGLRVSTTPRH